ncbi:MAG: peptidoglycan DD-metalloendopeptidase family protein [Actinomycetes bacterium]
MGWLPNVTAREGTGRGGSRGRRVRSAVLLTAALSSVLLPGAAAAEGSAGQQAAPQAVGGPGQGQTGSLAEGSQAVVQAAEALQQARADLAQASTRVAEAAQARARARHQHAEALGALEVARAAELGTEREIASAFGQISADRNDLSSLARVAYERGRYAEWSAILEASTPAELSARLTYVDTLGRSFQGHIDSLARARAQLADRQRLLAVRRGQREAVEHRAQASLAASRRLAVEAEDARTEVAALVAQRETALAAAEDAKAADLSQYTTLQAASGALGARIQSLAAQMDGGGRPAPTSLSRPTIGAVTSSYGPRLHPILGYVKVHTGTDFGYGDGRVRAAASGVVLLTESDVAYGNMTVVHHGWLDGRSVSTLYAHQASVAVRPGQQVGRGQVLGAVGSTGYSTGPHLHLEVRLGGTPTDPMPWLG